MKAQKFTLLIVDDNEDDRFFLERALLKASNQYRIHHIESGAKAVAYLKGEGIYADRKRYQFPSYIIVDLKMNLGDGFQVLDHVKRNPALSIIPVVMFSASDDEDDIRQAYLLGASSYFVKPAGSEELDDLVLALHKYWTYCHVPEVDEDGYALMTDSKGKRGARFTRPTKDSPEVEA
jgi:CheY-like chemotaxis protein